MEAYYKSSLCYICKKKHNQKHYFYEEMCQECGDFNLKKRLQKGDLTGKTALVTGGRIKIGYEVALILLRNGCEVITTSRFPNDTFLRYQKELDFDKWKDSLSIYGVDFRHLASVSYFIEELLVKYSKLDIIINNAAQTVRKPPLFYNHLIQNEKKELKLIAKDITPKQLAQVNDIVKATNTGVLSIGDGDFSSLIHSSNNVANITTSAEFSQIPLLPEDFLNDRELFPLDEYDKDGQQVDRRETNSWMFKLTEVNLIEFQEVININLISPFLLNTKLKPLLMNANDATYIINVSAMEGNFYAPRKKIRHPHTNMVKAALNMMTRTSAAEYVEDDIYMSSVDTGWITNEKPFTLTDSEADRKRKMAIDEIDGAARILDPIFCGLNDSIYTYGKFLKNYEEYPW